MSGTLPTWLERWFGLSTGPGTGIAWRLGYHWPWPPWATLLGIAALVAAIVGVYLREGRQAGRTYRLALAALRLLSLGLVLLMIAQVELFLQRTGLPLVVAIIDDTRSMNTVDRYDDGVRKSLQDRVTKTLAAAAERKETTKAIEARQLSRWNLARMLFMENDGALLSSLADSHKLRFYYLSDLRETRGAAAPGILAELKGAEAKGNSTRLGSAIRGALDELRGTTPVAVVLATDGINTDGPGLLDAAVYARRSGVPLFLIGVGSDRPARELRLSDLEVEDVVFVDDLVPFRFKLTATGFAGKKVPLVLRQEKAADGEGQGEIVARSEVTIAADGRPQEVVLPYRPTRTGQFRYTIDVEPPRPTSGSPDLPAHPLPLARNVRVREEKIRVLLVEGVPRFEYRFLRNLLAREKTVDLRVLLQGADIDFGDEAREQTLKVFPVRREGPDGLFSYDVVIFGDVNPALLSPSALANLADFGDHKDGGGALLLVAGPNFMPLAYRDTPLARLLPFDPAQARNPDSAKPLTDGFVVQPTELGLASPPLQLGDTQEQSRTAWRKLPPLYWMTEVQDLKPSARVLAEHPARKSADGKRLPIILMQYVGGGGKVLFHATDETYRWRRRVGDLYFARYWIQTLRFLARSKLAEGDRSVRLGTDRREYSLGDPVRVQVRFADERLAPLDDNGVTVELEQVGRQVQKVQLRRTETGRGHFEAVLHDLPSGDYHAKLISPPAGGAPTRGSRRPISPSLRRRPSWPACRWTRPRCGRPRK